MASFITAFIITIVACVCNPRSKRSFHKHKSFILTHDLPNEVPQTPTDLKHPPQPPAPPSSLKTATTATTKTNLNATLAVSSDIELNKVKVISLNRALPDIPHVATNGTIPLDADGINSNDDVDSLYTVAIPNSVVTLHNNHPYARIRNNQTVDSSTENDTDDYSESRIIQPVTATVQCHNETSPFHANVHDNPNDTYELEPQPHILRLQLRNNVEPQLFVGDSDTKKEISYNTISVREPLSKVLAERDNIEHHYNEVEEERISSFYEEISTGPCTYVKSNNVKTDYGEPIASTSRSMVDHSENIIPPINDSIETNGPVYSFVDKKMKRVNIQTNPSNAMIDNNNLYTMVVKSPANSSKVVDTNPILQRYSPPPPLPPPLNREHGTQSKSFRNTIMFGTPSNSSANYSAFNGSDTSAEQNIYDKIIRTDSDKDPGYETVYKEVEPDSGSIIDLNQNDYGYEAIMIDEIDPAYEIVKPENGYETIKNQNTEQPDPNYEIISRPIRHGLKAHSPVDEHNVHNGSIIDENIIIEHL